MAKRYIDDQAPVYAFDFDPAVPMERQVAAREALARFVERRRREMADPPPEGMGLDGRPLQGTQNVERRTMNAEKVENDVP